MSQIITQKRVNGTAKAERICLIVGAIWLLSTSIAATYIIKTIIEFSGGGSFATMSFGTDDDVDSVELTEDGDPLPIILAAPKLDSWKPELQTLGSHQLESSTRYARSYHYKGYIYKWPAANADVIGVVRPGNSIIAKESVGGKQCKGGSWYGVHPTGFVCTKRGFVVENFLALSSGTLPEPAVKKRLPFQYAEVITKRALRFNEIPSIQQEKQAQQALEDELDNDQWPEILSDVMDGIYFVAIHKLVESEGRKFYRTVRGRYVRVKDVKVYPTYPMRGERLDTSWKLPIAFVYGENRAAYRVTSGGTLKKVGLMEKHARFVAAKSRTIQGEEYIQGLNGVVIKRDDVRLIEKINRPSEIPRNHKWIHINLTEQTLLAYEGDKPVYATLVSSGKEGYLTPRGIFQIRHKYITTTMNGDDPIDGYYEVEEVPWTMFYWKAYAVHGAYWHNDFGVIRSHGCTNVAPADARWLHYWTEPEVPQNWHSIRFAYGTWLYFTRLSDDGKTHY